MKPGYTFADYIKARIEDQKNRYKALANNDKLADQFGMGADVYARQADLRDEKAYVLNRQQKDMDFSEVNAFYSGYDTLNFTVLVLFNDYVNWLLKQKLTDVTTLDLLYQLQVINAYQIYTLTKVQEQAEAAADMRAEKYVKAVMAAAEKGEQTGKQGHHLEYLHPGTVSAPLVPDNMVNPLDHSAELRPILENHLGTAPHSSTTNTPVLKRRDVFKVLASTIAGAGLLITISMVKMPLPAMIVAGIVGALFGAYAGMTAAKLYKRYKHNHNEGLLESITLDMSKVSALPADLCPVLVPIEKQGVDFDKAVTAIISTAYNNKLAGPADAPLNLEHISDAINKEIIWKVGF